jgi:hypothetical protein
VVSRSLGRNEFQIAYNYGSGDGSPTDGKHETFDNLFPLNHPYYGYMDLFSLQNVKNLELNLRRRLGNEANLYVSMDDFELADSNDAWYGAGLAPIRVTTADVGTHVGTEIVVTYQTRLFSERIGLTVGASAFFGSSYVRSFGLSQDAFFYFASLSYATK